MKYIASVAFRASLPLQVPTDVVGLARPFISMASGLGGTGGIFLGKTESLGSNLTYFCFSPSKNNITVF